MPPALQRFAEWYLGLPPAGAGQGTSWRLDWGPSAGAEYSPAVLCWLAAAAAAVMTAVYVKETSALGWRPRLMLLATRLTVVALLLLMLGRLSVRVDRTELPTVAVLVDTSASMGLADQYADPATARFVRQLAGSQTASPLTRLQLVQALLSRNAGEWWQTLERTHQVRVYAFDQHLRLLSHDPAADPPTDSGPGALLRDLTPAGDVTAPATALKELLDDLRGTNPAAVVLFTDGIASGGEEERLSQAAALARERGVPLYPVAVGSRDPSRDLELFDLLAPDEINLGEPVTLSLRYRQFGLAGQTSELSVTANGEAVPWLVQPLVVGEPSPDESLELTVTPPSEGEFDLSITAAALPDETDLENNVVRHHLSVRRDPLRVLLVEGRPRWEYRALKPVLERDDGLQVETFLQSADLNYAPEDRTALSAFPVTQEQLDRYDVVIWGDVDLGDLDPDVDDRLRSFVRDHGGGLLLIAGEDHNPLDYQQTSLELLLPVSLIDATSSTGLPPETPIDFRLQRTLEGKSTSFLRLAEGAEDEAVWQALPRAMHWFVATPETKPGASVLAVGSDPFGDRPLIVQQHYGRGQVLYHGVDSLWTWKQRVEDRYFGRYWTQAIRGLAAGRRRTDEAGRKLTSDRRVYELGDEVRLRLTNVSEPEHEASASLSVTIDSQVGERFTTILERRAAAPQLWEGEVRDLPQGEFRAHLGVDDDRPAASCTFRIQLPNRELRQRATDFADLERAARLSNGRAFSLAEAGRVPSEIPRGRPVKVTESQPVGIWNRWELLALMVLLLAAEWLLRRRHRLV